ncbi:alpha/beta fold hydrolase [Vibrio sp. D431a]|uniref:lipase family alpha/beta hydrolase n=1 Tax=Vibrio sp. D431a TaxID=2837388 RepID=UPI002554811D|nr:alpha/beta fold hydrolase [Vibrio sp. D431a]MDK9793333.1 alpha/beta fold hydrolase [Vibrio sp. D431a]
MKKIIILHGLYMHGVVMQPLAMRLQKLGFETEIISYNSLCIDLDLIYAKIDQSLSNDKVNVLVGHSLGGVLSVMYAELRNLPESKLSHIVTLGSPLAGASIAERIVELGIGSILGSSYDVGLKVSPRRWNSKTRLGSISGSLPLGLRGVLIRDREASDGTITIDETIIDGLHDHIVLNSSHTSLVYAKTTATQIYNFISENRFIGD